MKQTGIRWRFRTFQAHRSNTSRKHIPSEEAMPNCAQHGAAFEKYNRPHNGAEQKRNRKGGKVLGMMKKYWNIEKTPGRAFGLIFGMNHIEELMFLHFKFLIAIFK